MSTLIKVKQWSWKHFFNGVQSIITKEEVTEQQVRSWIGQSTQRGGGGNYDTKSLTSKTIKVKERRTTITSI
jgi:hypothetical protein